MLDCTACELHKTAICVGVSARGPEQAKVLLVGEAPGNDENTQGIAFVGRSGRLLDEMLAAAGYTPAEVRITNAVRCQPPRIDGIQQKPTPAQIDACRQHLVAEIAAARPEVIIAMGDTALQSLCKTSGIGEKRGGTFPVHPSLGVIGVEVWPTLHPAFVARVDSMRETVIADLRRVRASTTPEEIVPFLIWDGSPLRGGLISYDIETLDAEGAIVEEPTQISVASHGDGVLVTTDVRAMAYALVDAQRRGAWLVGHNAWTFDGPKLRSFGHYGLRDDLDTMALAYLDNEEQPLALESLAVRYLGVRGWKADGHRDARLGTEAFRQYNARDAWYTLLLAEALFTRLTPKHAALSRLLLDLRHALDDCTTAGIRVDAGEIARFKPAFESEVEQALDELRAVATDVWRVPTDPEKKRTVRAIEKADAQLHNPNSTAEVARVLIASGYRLGTTPTGKPKTDKKTINELLEANPGDRYPAALIAYREATKSLSTYIEPYEHALAEGDGRVHPEYTILRTVTNRTSARGPNVQNLDRDLKSILAVTKVDYSAIEFRTAAFAARETTIVSRFQADPNWDPHRYFASAFLYQIAPEDVTSEQRQISKSANFSQLFGGTWVTLLDYAAKMGIALSENESRRISRLWHQAFPAFKPWYGAVAEEVYEDGYVETATGFRRHYGDIKNMPAPRIAEIVREAVNCKAQTLAAHIAYCGMAALRRRNIPVVGFFHDAYGFDFASPHYMEYYRPQIIEALTVEPITRLRTDFGVAFDIPLVVKFED